LPDSSSLYYNRGAAYRKLNNFTQAIVDYNKAILLRPKFLEAIIARGVAKGYLNDRDGALKDFQLAIKTDSTYAIAYNNYGSIIEDSDIPGAIDYYSKAIHFNKNYTTAYFARGKLYAKLSKKEEACRDYKRAESLGMVEAKIERMVNCQ
jgi:tetratricopeptide (TPR) repeat protein